MVIHFAGLTAAGDSMKDPLSCCDVNAGGTLALLHAMDRHAVRRVIFSSSATVHGRTRLSAESILTDWVRTHPGACTVLLRYFNPVGAHASA